MAEPGIHCHAWALPSGDTGPGVARGLLRDTLRQWRLPDELIDDAVLAVSELTANLVQHVMSKHHDLRDRSPELWLYRRGAGERDQIVCKAFDPLRDWAPDTPADELDEHGRGLSIVDAVVTDWGCHLTRSMLGGPGRSVPGKAVWFAIDAPLAPEPTVAWTAPEAARLLQRALVTRDIPCRRDQDGGRAVVSVFDGPIVRCEERTFTWMLGRELTRRPYGELVEVTERLVQIHEQRTARTAGSSTRASVNTKEG